MPQAAMSARAEDVVRIAHRGFAARSGREGGRLRSTLARLDLSPANASEIAGGELATWGLGKWHREADALLLGASARRHEEDLSPAEVRRVLTDDPSAFAELLPTFGAAVATLSGAVSVATDYLGFRHVFHGQRDGAAIVSTSSHVCAIELGSGLDLEAVAVQSSLGWQLDQRTLFEGVQKLEPGGIATVQDGTVTFSSSLRPAAGGSPDLDDAVRAAAEVLRTYLLSYLEDHPDVGLQLTGGQDSRLLLSAIPRARRKGLRVVTLGIPGNPDVEIAGTLAARYGMRHELLSLSGLERLGPAEAYRLCLDAARRLDYSADPLAHAALSYAEARSEPGPRISGLGGEVARGFYYLGRPTSAPVSPGRARRLAQWRMFVNEAVPAEALDPAFGEWAREFATREVERILMGTRRPWMSATDELYLAHRMQRWGGVTETAVCLDRQIINPMLDDRFISIANSLEPLDKRNSRFLSRLQLELDAELGAVPLEGRPPPEAYADRSMRNSARLTATTVHKARRKVVQRVRGRSRPPAGGEILAGKVLEYWRGNPEDLESLAALHVFRAGWLEALAVGGETPPSTSAVALMVNLVAATGAP
jgi:asparagine synthase (glutamine-hydrolysing)